MNETRRQDGNVNEQADTEVRRNRAVEYIGAEAVNVVYTNSVNLTMTPWDMQLAIGVIDNVVEDRVIIRSLLKLVMSPQHAKALNDILARNLELYEARFGRIPTQPTQEQGD